MNFLTQFAETGANKGGILEALGIDWKMLIFQIIAFIILVWFCGKYIYPIFMKTIDARQDAIEAGTKAALASEKKAQEAKAEITALLKQARADASDIVVTAKEEAAAALAAAEAKSKTQAERIVAEAHDRLEKDIVAAKKSLHNETLELVALATEKVVGKTVTAKVDHELVASAVKEAM